MDLQKFYKHPFYFTNNPLQNFTQLPRASRGQRSRDVFVFDPGFTLFDIEHLCYWQIFTFPKVSSKKIIFFWFFIDLFIIIWYNYNVINERDS